MLILVFSIFGLLGIVLAAIAAVSNRRRAASGTPTARWIIARRWSGRLGLLLGIGSIFVSYPLQHQGETWRVMGFPFFAAAFDSRGADYVGITTIPAMIGNFVFFFALPQIILWTTGRSRGQSA